MNTETVPQAVVSRLVRAISATALGPIVKSAIQLGSVPLLLHAWGASKYGDWLLISAIPTYLTFTDLGFGASSGSDMTMRVARGDREGALATFQSSWALLSLISLAIVTPAAIAVWWLPWHNLLHLATLTSREAGWTLLALAGWTLAVQQWSVIESGYRCDGNFALGNFSSTVEWVLEAAAGTFVGVVTSSLLLVAMSYLGLRLLGLVCYWLLLRQRSPWITLGLRHASIATVREMLAPSLGFIAMPLGAAVSVQGFLLVVGVVLGPVAVTVFSTARTLTRIGLQIINSLGSGIWPELSTAFGAGNLLLARKLHRHAYQASLILAFSCATSLWLFGPKFYASWVRNAVVLDLPCFHLLLIVSVANSLWFASAIVQMSANRHSRLAVTYLLAALCSCGFGYLLTEHLGLVGAAAALLLIDLTMCSFVLPTTLEQMNDTPREFVRGVFGRAPGFVKPLLVTCGFRR